jgi:hypothetical protein
VSIFWHTSFTLHSDIQGGEGVGSGGGAGGVSGVGGGVGAGEGTEGESYLHMCLLPLFDTSNDTKINRYRCNTAVTLLFYCYYTDVTRL